MRKRKEDKIYKTQVQLSLNIDTLSVIDRFQEYYEDERNQKYSKGEVLELLLSGSPMYKEKLDKLIELKSSF